MTIQPDGWLTIREAALTLGVSDLTIRRRIKDGRIAHRFQNGKYFVSLSTPAPVEETSIATDPDPEVQADDSQNPVQAPAPAPAPLFDLAPILEEQARLAERAGRATALEERLREVEMRYEQTRESLVALANRNGWLEGKLEEREHEIKLLTDSEHRKSWWRRLFGA